MALGGLVLSAEVQVEPGTDAEELFQLMGRLREELLDLDVDSVQLAARDEVPAGSKGAGLLASGGLLIRIAAGHDVLQALVAGVRSWLQRQRAHSVKLTLDGDSLEVTGISSAEQDRLIELWVTRHADAG